MSRCLVMVLGMGVIGLWSVPQAESASSGRYKVSQLILDGKKVDVIWPDGDTFRLVSSSGQRRGPAARLMGYNSLENYGPVHKWGGWTAQDLYHVGNQASKVAKSRAWRCFTRPGSGGYGRILATCPKLAETLISRGLAHVFSMTQSGDPKLLKLQQEAIRKKRGIWAKGAPAYIVTSVHGASRYRKLAYNRLISTSTGGSMMYRHGDSYNVCGWVCLRGSCMRYVPHRRRFGPYKASCLRVLPPNTNSKTKPTARATPR